MFLLILGRLLGRISAIITSVTTTTNACDSLSVALVSISVTLDCIASIQLHCVIRATNTKHTMESGIMGHILHALHSVVK